MPEERVPVAGESCPPAEKVVEVRRPHYTQWATEPYGVGRTWLLKCGHRQSSHTQSNSRIESRPSAVLKVAVQDGLATLSRRVTDSRLRKYGMAPERRGDRFDKIDTQS